VSAAPEDNCAPRTFLALDCSNVDDNGIPFPFQGEEE
jgi:hypothetical protein